MNRQLFGGAITAPVSSTFIDASNLRQIPDNQEVFIDMNTQQSLIFELLEQVEANQQSCAKYHFEQLAADNDAINPCILSIDTLDVKQVSPLLPANTTEIYLLQGTQDISKFNEKNAYNTVDIMLAVIRFTNVSTDFIVSVNAPIRLSATSSEQESVNQTQSVDLNTVKNEIIHVINHLNVKDWSLFGHE
ncbi:ran guanine nucleotide release factor-like protein [Pilobolus umbonatus]|nr:ran guanine nucleotide release factor-like protein [Pilobolus umbonatus]